MASQETGDERGQPEPSEGDRRRYAQQALRRGRPFGDLRIRRRQFLEDDLHPLEIAFAGFRDRHAPCRADEQTHTQPRLELADAPRNHGCVALDPLRRSRKTAEFRNGDERLDLLESSAIQLLHILHELNGLRSDY